jgi:stage V sporulation protein AA
MIYAQLKERVVFAPHAPLFLRDVAKVTPEDEQVLSLPVACPGEAGVWKLDSLALAQAITRGKPQAQVTLLGPDVCYVHRVAHAPRGRFYHLRLAAALVLLTVGSALALAWFHSDVDMPAAQKEIFALLAGGPPENPLLIHIPYALGVGLGVALFYSLLGRTSISPMEIKLKEYRESLEATEGREIPRG